MFRSVKKSTLGTVLLLSLLLCALLAACGTKDGGEQTTEEIDPVTQFSDVREQFLARMITTDYQNRYQILVEATANATTVEQTEAAYAAYCAGFEQLVTDYLLQTMQEKHDPYIYDEREFEQGRLLTATGFSFETISAENNVTNYKFTINVQVESDLGQQEGTINCELTVRSTEDGDKVGNYFFYSTGWLADIHSVGGDSTDSGKD